MRKKIVLSLIISLAFVFSAQAQTTSSTSVEELQKQLQLLLSQISSLQKEVTSLKSAPPTTSVTTPTTPTATSISPPTAPTVPPSILPIYSPLLEVDESEVGETETAYVPPPQLTRSLFLRSRGEDVRQLQEFLAQDPSIYPEATVTGYYGPSTAAAVKRWQAKNGVPAVGIVGRQTIARFKELYNKGPLPTKPTRPDYPERPDVCAVYSPITCPAGEERYQVSNPLSYSSCPIYACRSKDKSKPEICPALPTVDACPAGEERIVTYKSEQCGAYYTCKQRETSRADNTIATLKKISSIQTDNRYTINLYDPEGVQKFAVYNAKGAEIHSGYPACRRDWSSPVISVNPAEFPLKLNLSDCASSQYTTALSTPVIVRQVEEGLTFPYKFSNGKVVYSSEEARSYCYANGPGSGQSVAAECETKFGVVYTNVTTTTTSSGRAIYLTDAFASCMAKYGFSAEAKQIKTWAQSPDAIPWSTLTNAAQNAVPVCEREYYGQQTVETGSVLCSDGKDNDGDGFVDMADPSCNYTTTTVPAGQKEQVWNSLGLKSWIRTDADSARIDQLKAACASVPSNSNIWTPNAGLSSSADFGMPDTSKCQRASSCTASQRFDGAACVANTTTTTTTGTAQCSDGKDNDGDGKIDYPNDTGCYSSADNDETPGTTTTTGDTCPQYGSGWHTMGSGGNCFDPDMKNYRTANGTLYSCSTTPTSGCSGTTTTATAQCSDGRDNDNDGQIDYPNDSGCYSRDDNDETYGTTTTTTGTCDSALTALLGTGCHYMYNDSAGNQTYCDGPMTKSAKRGDTAATTGCTSSTTGSWPTDQASCTSRGYNWCTSSTSWCQTGSCPTSTTGGTTYAGDANSCPGFAYSRWDQQNRRYCQLNTESRCDYNYPSYLTNGANYTAANCPTTTSVGSDTSTWCSPLGSGWSVYGNYCLNSSRTQYAPVSSPNSSSVQACAGADSPVTGCTPPSGSTTTTTTTTSTGSCSQYGEGWHVMGDNNCYNSGMTEYRTANGTLYSCSSTPSSGCSSGSTTTTSSSSTCGTGQYWNGTACVTSTTSSSSCSTPSNCYDSAICASSGWYWYNSGCWSSPQSSTTSSTSSTTCASGQYWNGTSCVSSTSTTDTHSCPSGQYWNGTACVTSTTPSASIYDQMRKQLGAMEAILKGLLGR